MSSQSYRVPKTFGSLRVAGSFTPTATATVLTSITSSTYALSSVDSGKTIVLSSAVALTLPPVARSTAVGFTLLLASGSTTASTLTKATSDSACIYGIVAGVNTAGVAKSSISTATGGNAGDFLEVLSNGTNWFVRGDTANPVVLA